MGSQPQNPENLHPCYVSRDNMKQPTVLHTVLCFHCLLDYGKMSW